MNQYQFQEEGYAGKVMDKPDATGTGQHFLQHHNVLKKSATASRHSYEKTHLVVFDC